MDTLLQEGQTPQSLSPLTLAFVGDGVYELLVREHLVAQGNCPVRKLHSRKVELVRCQAQAKALESLWPVLSEEERESFLSLGEKLGYLDREMQVAQLTLLEEELGYRIKTLKSAMPKQQKTYQSMGILGGILLAVLLW